MSPPQRKSDALDWLHDAFGLGLGGLGSRQRLPIRKHRWWSYTIAIIEVPAAVVLVWVLHRWLGNWLLTAVIGSLAVLAVGMVAAGVSLVRYARRNARS